MQHTARNLATVALIGLALTGGAQGQTTANDIMLLEQRLMDLGYLSGKMDGKSDPELVAALKEFQALHGLPPSGELGVMDRRMLFSTVARPAPRRAAQQAAPGAAAAPPPSAAPAAAATATASSGAAAAAPIAAQTQPVSAAVNTSPLGSWYAEMTCKQGRRDTLMETEFTIGQRADGVYEMAMVVASPDSMGSGTSDIRYIGERVGEQIRFVVEKQVRAPIFRSPNTGKGSELTYTPATRQMVSEAECAPFTAQRMDASSPRLISTAPAPANGGAFYAALGDRERCEALIAWVDRANREVPGRDFYRENRRGDDWILIKLFADDDFVPVFGRPFDAMPLDARKEVRNFAQNTCGRDPFTRNRMDLYNAAASRVLPGDPDQQLTSNGYSSTLFAIRQIRALRNELRALASGNAAAQAGESFGETVARMERVRTLASRDEGRLWPSEVAAVDASINRFLDGQATAEATRFLQALVAETDPARGLNTIATHKSSASRDDAFARHLSSANRSSLDTQIKQLQAQFASALIAPQLARAQAAPADLEGATLIVAILADVAKNGTLPPENKTSATETLQKARDERVAAFVTQQTALLAGLPDTLDGLTREKDWIEGFRKATSQFSSVPAVSAALTKALNARTARLEAAYPAFQSDLAQTKSPAEVDALLAAYLGLPSDGSLPIALEYQLSAELQK